jgi:hypothetical protein
MSFICLQHVKANGIFASAQVMLCIGGSSWERRNGDHGDRCSVVAF